MSWRATGLLNCHINEYTHVYEFGVLTGDSVIEILNLFQLTHKKVDAVFGFDSFCGLPEVPPDEIKQETWVAGAMDAQARLQCPTIGSCVEAVSKKIANPIVKLIPGFYEDSLHDGLVQQYGMQPAFYVDIDCDLYSSTYHALDFMFRNGLIKAGTYVGYDDWGGTEGWENCLSGESLAHTQLSKLYGVSFKPVFQCGKVFPHVQKIFVCT